MAWAVLSAASAEATVLDFETLANGRPSSAGRSAANEYAAFGVIFAGGSDFPGQPAFRALQCMANIGPLFLLLVLFRLLQVLGHRFFEGRKLELPAL